MILDPRLELDSEFVCDLPLSQVRLHHNAAFPWILLIPRQANLVDIIDVLDKDQIQLWREIRQASCVMRDIFGPDKLNIANLGNVVSQLHIHVIARFRSDSAWPNPVWNSGIQRSYLPEDKEHTIILLKTKFKISYG